MSQQDEANAASPVAGYQIEAPVDEVEGQEDIHDEDEANLAALDEEIGEDHEADDIEPIDEEAEKEMEELEKLMESTATPSKGVVPAGAVPTEQSGRLSSHAAEFWFPECRECKCCNGFKHGCSCVKNDKFIACQAATCTIDPAHKDQKLTEDTMPQQRADNNSSRRSTSDNSNVCRFEQSPGGCRFGASCRFRHVNGGGGGGGGGSGYDNNGSYGRKQGQRGGHSGYNNQYGNSNRSYSDPNQYGYPADPGYQYSYYQDYPPQAPYPGYEESQTYHHDYYGQPTSTGHDQVCQLFLKGSCKYGANCRFKHV